MQALKKEDVKKLSDLREKIRMLDKDAQSLRNLGQSNMALRIERKAQQMRNEAAELRRQELQQAKQKAKNMKQNFGRREFKEGDPTGDKCYYCNADRVWIKHPNPTEGKTWMKSCPNYPHCRRPGWNKKDEVKGVDEAHLAALVEAKVSQAVAKLADNNIKEIVWKINEVELAKLEKRPHMALTDVLARVKAGLKNILLVGPAGSGKTTLCADLAESMKLGFASASCSGGMPEWHLTGRSLPDLTTGKSRYEPSEFVRLYEEGGVFLLDEVDAADPNVMVIINSAIANGYLNIPARTENPQAQRHTDFYLICAANTFGTGGNMQYQGRNALDAATLDRFVGAIIVVDYDRKLEESLVTDADVLLRVWAIRDRVEKLKLRRIVGTRSLLAANALRQSGETLEDSIKAILVGWTEDEKSKMGEVWR